MKLNVTAFGISAAFVSVLILIAYSIIAAVWGVGLELEGFLESLYPGYTLSISGTIVGCVWQFGITIVITSLFACVYNFLSKDGK